MKITIDKTNCGKTVKDILVSCLSLSRGQISSLKRDEKGILVNKKRVTVRYVLSENDILEIALEDDDNSINAEIEPVDIAVDILFEDDDVICINKPCGMTVHPSYNHRRDTLANALSYLFMKRGIPFVFRAVNRLDRETSGVILVAKNRRAAAYLSAEMQVNKFTKRYIAVVCGEMNESYGVINNYITRREDSIVFRCVKDRGSESEYAETIFDVIHKCNGLSLVNVQPITGRTHQIRVHFSSMGYPIYGDGLYGQAASCGLMLHAHSLEFPLLNGKRVKVIAPVPDRFREVCDEVERFF